MEFETLPDGRLQLFVDKRMLVLRFAREAEASADAARLRELLRLVPGRRTYDVVELEDSDFDPLDPDKLLTELGIDTRSLMGVLYYLSNGVEVLPGDLESGIVTATVDAAQNPFDWSALMSGLFQVRVSEGRRRPSDATLAVRHRKRWFSIPDGDLSSRSTFLLVSQLFTLQAGDVDEVKPVLTLPVGGR